MSLNASRLAPLYVRLSGEIVDQSILNALRAAYPAARISQTFASISRSAMHLGARRG
jgi:hypothetical protein